MKTFKALAVIAAACLGSAAAPLDMSGLVGGTVWAPAP